MCPLDRTPLILSKPVHLIFQKWLCQPQRNVKIMKVTSWWINELDKKTLGNCSCMMLHWSQGLLICSSVIDSNSYKHSWASERTYGYAPFNQYEIAANPSYQTVNSVWSSIILIQSIKAVHPDGLHSVT